MTTPVYVKHHDIAFLAHHERGTIPVYGYTPFPVGNQFLYIGNGKKQDVRKVPDNFTPFQPPSAQDDYIVYFFPDTAQWVVSKDVRKFTLADWGKAIDKVATTLLSYELEKLKLEHPGSDYGSEIPELLETAHPSQQAAYADYTSRRKQLIGDYLKKPKSNITDKDGLNDIDLYSIIMVLRD